MSAIPRKAQSDSFKVRVSPAFKAQMEHAATKGGYASLSDFVKAAIREQAAKHGVKIQGLY